LERPTDTDPDNKANAAAVTVTATDGTFMDEEVVAVFDTAENGNTTGVARDEIAAVLDLEVTGVEAPALDLDLDLDKDKKNNAKKSKRRPAVIPKIETSAITS
jgi:hypothetical protein